MSAQPDESARGMAALLASVSLGHSESESTWVVEGEVMADLHAQLKRLQAIEQRAREILDNPELSQNVTEAGATAFYILGEDG